MPIDKRSYYSFLTTSRLTLLQNPLNFDRCYTVKCRVKPSAYKFESLRYTSISTTAMAPSSQPSHEFISFLNESPSPYHAVHSIRERLERAGFEQLLERDDWAGKCKPGGKYYITRNASTIAAWAVGRKWSPGGPFALIGAHTDSPCLRIKPVSHHKNEGFLQVGVETYGGGLWHTWFDRDLGVAGRVMVKTENDELVQRLVNIRKPILRIPTLAIHLDRQEKFEFNKETQLFPIAGMVAADLERQGLTASADPHPAPKENDSKNGSFEPLKSVNERHHPRLVDLIAESAKVKPAQIQDFELLLYDTQKACTGGFNDELIYSARLDNLGMSYCGTMALIDSVDSAPLDNENCIRLLSCFDDEEVGSTTAQGAQSNLLPSLIRRLSVLSTDPSGNSKETSSSDAYERSLARSFLISADMAHSFHPNYAGT